MCVTGFVIQEQTTYVFPSQLKNTFRQEEKPSPTKEKMETTKLIKIEQA